MYIKIGSPHTRRIGRRIEGFDGLVEAEFNNEGVARVKAEEGEALAEAVDSIEILEREKKSSQEEDE